jgi:hypothetical protein
MVLAVIALVALLAVLALVAGAFRSPVRRRRVVETVVREPVTRVVEREVVTERSVVERDPLL